MRIGTISPKRGKYHSLDIGTVKISFEEFKKYGRIELILNSTRNDGLAEYPQYLVTLSENEINDLYRMLKTNTPLHMDRQGRLADTNETG